MAYTERRPVSILVHNVAHSDLVLSTFQPTSSSGLPSTLVRPHYGSYALTVNAVLNHLILTEPLHLSVVYETLTEGHTAPIGLTFSPGVALPTASFSLTAAAAATSSSSQLTVSTVFFPTIAAILPHWLASHPAKGPSKGVHNEKRLVYLLSGNSESGADTGDVDQAANSGSTEHTAVLVSRFVRQCYPHLIVNHIANPDDVFRFDDNTKFLKHALVPQIDAQRNGLLDAYAEGEWQQHFSVIIALAAGAPARLAALNASCRTYRPSFLHVTNVKSFVHTGSIGKCFSSVSLLDFASVEATAAVPVHELESDIRDLVLEMRRYLDVVLLALRGAPFAAATAAAALHDGAEGGSAAGAPAATPNAGDGLAADNELATFWLRKTRQPVLAVLAVRRGGPSAPLTFYRAMNLEVSMPTGSLCSERAAISQALANDPGLRRRDLRAVAVLSLPKLGHPDPRTAAAYETAGVTQSASFYSARKASSSTHAAAAASAAKLARPPAHPSHSQPTTQSSATKIQQSAAPPGPPQQYSSSSGGGGSKEGLLPRGISAFSTGSFSGGGGEDGAIQGRSFSGSSMAAAGSTLTVDAFHSGTGPDGGPLPFQDPRRSVSGPPKRRREEERAGGDDGPSSMDALVRGTGTRDAGAPGGAMPLSSFLSRASPIVTADTGSNSSSASSELMPPPPPPSALRRGPPSFGSGSSPASASPTQAQAPKASNFTQQQQQQLGLPARPASSFPLSTEAAAGAAGQGGAAATHPSPRMVGGLLDGGAASSSSSVALRASPSLPPQEASAGGASLLSATTQPPPPQRSRVESPTARLGRSASGAGAPTPYSSSMLLAAAASASTDRKRQPAAANNKDWGGSDSGTTTPIRAPSLERGGAAPSASLPPACLPLHAALAEAGVAAHPPSAVSAAAPRALNPIMPCGACLEWLRKVSEANPAFQVVTFQDISCIRVFVQPVPWS